MEPKTDSDSVTTEPTTTDLSAADRISVEYRSVTSKTLVSFEAEVLSVWSMFGTIVEALRDDGRTVRLEFEEDSDDVEVYTLETSSANGTLIGRGASVERLSSWEDRVLSSYTELRAEDEEERPEPSVSDLLSAFERVHELRDEAWTGGRRLTASERLSRVPALPSYDRLDDLSSAASFVTGYLELRDRDDQEAVSVEEIRSALEDARELSDEVSLLAVHLGERYGVDLEEGHSVLPDSARSSEALETDGGRTVLPSFEDYCLEDLSDEDPQLVTDGGVDEDEDPTTECFRCGETFRYLTTRGAGPWTSVSVNHHTGDPEDDHAESLCRSCGLDLDEWLSSGPDAPAFEKGDRVSVEGSGVGEVVAVDDGAAIVDLEDRPGAFVFDLERVRLVDDVDRGDGPVTDGGVDVSDSADSLGAVSALEALPCVREVRPRPSVLAVLVRPTTVHMSPSLDAPVAEAVPEDVFATGREHRLTVRDVDRRVEGFVVTFDRPTEAGVVDLERLAAAVDAATELVEEAADAVPVGASASLRWVADELRAAEAAPSDENKSVDRGDGLMTDGGETFEDATREVFVPFVEGFGKRYHGLKACAGYHSERVEETAERLAERGLRPCGNCLSGGHLEEPDRCDGCGRLVFDPTHRYIADYCAECLELINERLGRHTEAYHRQYRLREDLEDGELVTDGGVDEDEDEDEVAPTYEAGDRVSVEGRGFGEVVTAADGVAVVSLEDGVGADAFAFEELRHDLETDGGEDVDPDPLSVEAFERRVERLSAETSTLTEREAEVFALRTMGFDGRETAAILGIGRSSVDTYVSRVRRKRERAEGTVRAFGDVPVPEEAVESLLEAVPAMFLDLTEDRLPDGLEAGEREAWHSVAADVSQLREALREDDEVLSEEEVSALEWWSHEEDRRREASVDPEALLSEGSPVFRVDETLEDLEEERARRVRVFANRVGPRRDADLSELEDVDPEEVLADLEGDDSSESDLDLDEDDVDRGDGPVTDGGRDVEDVTVLVVRTGRDSVGVAARGYGWPSRDPVSEEANRTFLEAMDEVRESTRELRSEDRGSHVATLLVDSETREVLETSVLPGFRADGDAELVTDGGRDVWTCPSCRSSWSVGYVEEHSEAFGSHSCPGCPSESDVPPLVNASVFYASSLSVERSELRGELRDLVDERLESDVRTGTHVLRDVTGETVDVEDVVSVSVSPDGSVRATTAAEDHVVLGVLESADRDDVRTDGGRSSVDLSDMVAAFVRDHERASWEALENRSRETHEDLEEEEE